MVLFVSDIRAEMPDVIGDNETVATASLRDSGLVNVTSVDKFTDAFAPGTVMASDPLAHQFALKSATITLTVARDTTVRVPEVHGYPEAEARLRLEYSDTRW